MAMKFCDSPLWDVNLTWYNDNPDFTLCFHDTVLVYLPAALLWLLAGVEVAKCRNSKNRGVPTTTLTIARLWLICALILFSLVDLFLELVLGLSSVSAVLAPIVSALTFTLSLVLSRMSMNSGRPTSAVQFVFYTLATAAATFTFTSVVRFPGTIWRRDQFAIFVIYYAVLLATYFMHFWADDPPKYIDKSRKLTIKEALAVLTLSNSDPLIAEQTEKTSPHITASYPSILVFNWVTKIIRVGWKKPLTDDDLYDLEPNDTCKVVNPKFAKNWDAQATRRARNNPEIKPRLSVLLPLVTTYYGIFLKGSFFALMSALLQQVPKVTLYF